MESLNMPEAKASAGNGAANLRSPSWQYFRVGALVWAAVLSSW